MNHIKSLKKKLTEAGIPTELHNKFVEFEEKYHGKEEMFGLNPVYWGILFEKTRAHGSVLSPDEVEVEEEYGIWYVACADVHISDTMSIDQFGKLYWSFKPRYSDFNLYFEGKKPDLEDN